MRTRWLCIGTLRLGGQIVHFGGQWSPCAVSINWRGRMDWCQPWQFTEWQSLWRAVERRLSFCGLRPVAHASRLPGTGEYQQLWVQVARCKRSFHRNQTP